MTRNEAESNEVGYRCNLPQSSRIHDETDSFVVDALNPGEQMMDVQYCSVRAQKMPPTFRRTKALIRLPHK